MKPELTKILNIDYPIILAPMFLITDVNMVKIALDNGITAAIPAHNYRTIRELEEAIREIKNYTDKPFGINLITNKSNLRCKQQLNVVLKNKPAFIISSLGSPKEIIKSAKKLGIKVFCDVVDLKYAQKVESLGADALIAVNNMAGGHSGKLPAEEIITQLQKNCNIPVIAAGGISTPQKLRNIMKTGVAGVSIGTVFIASKESPVSDGYKQALISYTAKDIVLTSKISGTPITVINTEYVQKIETKQSIAEKLLNKNNKLRKLIKTLIFLKGIKLLKKSAFSSKYKSVWCAGSSIDDITEIRELKEIIQSFIDIFNNS